MKNILLILIACLMVTMVKAAPNMDTSMYNKNYQAMGDAVSKVNSAKAKRAFWVEVYSTYKHQVEMSEKFLEAVKKGDVETIGSLEAQAKNPSYLMATDKFGNNAFHLAKDIHTVQAIARSIRNLYKDEFPGKILALKNQTNDSGVIPAVQAIFDLRPAHFFVLLEQTDLKQDILKVKSISRGGALAVAADAKQDKVLAGVQLADGFTAVDFARANRQVQGMDEVVAYFAENAPYL